MTRPRYVVVGDSLLDRDVWGVSTRSVPDGGGPVVDVTRTMSRPGGAALAAALLSRDGCDVQLVTALGNDREGDELLALLRAAGVAVSPLPTRDVTRQKVRIRTEAGTVARVDTGTRCVPTQVPTQVLDGVESSAALLASDYGGGVLTADTLRHSLAAARVPLVWDPHPRGREPVPGTTIATPNVSEARHFSGVEGYERQSAVLLRRWPTEAIAVTLGEAGAFVAINSGPQWVVPAPPVAPTDVCGAGDRFAASLTRLLGEGRSMPHAVKGAATEAAYFVARGGAAAVTSSPATPTVVAAGGCFDVLHVGHIELLQQARALGDKLVVLLNSDDSVRRLKGAGRPVVPQAERARMLMALACVDEVVVFDDDTPVVALRQLRPQVFVKGGDYVADQLPETAVMREWGGRVEIVPVVRGWSTSGMLAASGASVLGS